MSKISENLTDQLREVKHMLEELKTEVVKIQTVSIQQKSETQIILNRIDLLENNLKGITYSETVITQNTGLDFSNLKALGLSKKEELKWLKDMKLNQDKKKALEL